MRARVRVDELMDDPAIDGTEHDHALAGLARLNAWSRSHWLLWPRIATTARQANANGRTLRVLDVATGSGDGPIAMAQRARREGINIDWTLCDVSAHALEVARARAAAADITVATVRCDLLREAIPARADIVINSLFLHHCDQATAQIALARMKEAAEVAVAVTDLDRSRTGLALAWLGSRVLSRSRIVHYDALVSVRAAFTIEEARGLAQSAGLAGAHFERAWPARWRLWWSRA